MKRQEFYHSLLSPGVSGKVIWRSAEHLPTWRVLVRRGYVKPIPALKPNNYQYHGQCCYLLTEAGRNYVLNGGAHNATQIC